jgi:hypothetical protein
MSDESPGVRLDHDELRPLLERTFTVDELMAINDAHARRARRLTTRRLEDVPIEVVLIAAAANYVTVFMQTLAKHNAEALIEAVRTRFRGKGKGLEIVVGTEDDAAATLVITSNLPDEARLALLDLDVTAEEVRGKILRWDSDAKVWRAYSADD